VKFWTAEARASYEKPLALTQQEAERQFLHERFEELKRNSSKICELKEMAPRWRGHKTWCGSLSIPSIRRSQRRCQVT
jgi:hypothetical protein